MLLYYKYIIVLASDCTWKQDVGDLAWHADKPYLFNVIVSSIHSLIKVVTLKTENCYVTVSLENFVGEKQYSNILK